MLRLEIFLGITHTALVFFLCFISLFQSLITLQQISDGSIDDIDFPGVSSSVDQEIKEEPEDFELPTHDFMADSDNDNKGSLVSEFDPFYRLSKKEAFKFLVGSRGVHRISQDNPGIKKSRD